MPTAPQSAPGADPAGTFRVIQKETPPPSQINDALVIGLSVVAGIAALVFGVVLTLEGPLPLYGGALAIGLLSLAYAVRRYFTDRYPDVEAIEPRLVFSDAGGDDEPALAEVRAIGRRPLLRRLLIGAAGVLGISLLAPVSTLGPRVGDRLRRTAWRAGTRLVTTDGELLRPDTVAAGGVSTVWPEGAIGDERSAVLLLRLTAPPAPPTVLEWVVDGTLLAYSKICTHAGCPVALFRERDNALFCPCHQSTFAVARGAVPTFGPAARPLPQLPLGTDAAGNLIALGDFEAPVGPSFGSLSR